MTPVVVGCVTGFGLLFAGCGAVLRRAQSPRTPTLLFLGTGATMLLAAGLQVVTPTGADRTALLAALVLVPVLVLLYPDGRPAPVVGATATVLVAATGCLCVAWPRPTVLEAWAIVELCLGIAYLWWRVEHAAESERRALLWLVLSLGTGGLLAGHITFLVPSETASGVLSALVLVPVPVAMTVGILSPYIVDVRAATTRTVVEAVGLVCAVALFVGTLTLLQIALGHPASTGLAGAVAALCAVCYHPLRLVLLGTVDRLLFGEREDPVRAASHVGRGLDDPVLALRALREALVLPYAALLSRDETVAVSGAAPSALHTLDLCLGDRLVGRLTIGLRPGELRLSRRDRTVLDVVAPALAQTLHALTLTRQLHASRADVITAVEEERRRLRHDLHDTVGPTLTGIAYTADAARNTLDGDPTRAQALLAALRLDTAAAIDDVRRVVDGLRPPAVDELGLVGALEQQVVGLHSSDGRPVSVSLHAPAGLPHLPAAVEVAAYRIVTEALTNVVRHAHCHEATVRLTAAGSRLAVEVSDTGRSSTAWVPGTGMQSMRDRAEQLGGSFTADRSEDGGRVRAVLPLG